MPLVFSLAFTIPLVFLMTLSILLTDFSLDVARLVLVDLADIVEDLVEVVDTVAEELVITLSDVDLAEDTFAFESRSASPLTTAVTAVVVTADLLDERVTDFLAVATAVVIAVAPASATVSPVWDNHDLVGRIRPLSPDNPSTSHLAAASISVDESTVASFVMALTDFLVCLISVLAEVLETDLVFDVLVAADSLEALVVVVTITLVVTLPFNVEPEETEMSCLSAIQLPLLPDSVILGNHETPNGFNIELSYLPPQNSHGLSLRP